jgi:hypothetical protein
MSEMMEQEERKSGRRGNNNSSSYGTRRRKQQQQIEYSCGCRYLFNHQIILLHICPEHERELIILHS